MHAQITFSPSVSQRGENTIILSFKANVEEGWHVDGSIDLEDSKGVSLRGNLEKIHEGHFVQMVTITEKEYLLKGYFTYICCDDKMCLAPETAEFSYEGKLEEKKETASIEEEAVKDESAEETKIITDSIAEKPQKRERITPFLSSPLWQPTTIEAQQQDDGLWSVILLGFIGGLLALLTPCVWPIIPLTVSFFMKRGKGVYLFGASIVGMFVVLGLLVTWLFGSNAMNSIATSAAFNIVCFVVLLLLGLSLLGLFNISLPTGWSNSLDEMAGKTTGIISVMLMALTLVVVSFSCTAPVIGLLLVEVATEGSILAPLLGLTSFAIALALPFMIFARFPQWMQGLPRSGAWMTHVKVILGALEIAFSLKFLSVADQSYGWGILPPVAFLVIWAIIFGGMGVFLLFAYRSHYIIKGVGILSLALTIYLLQGIFTKQTSFVSAFMPVEMSEPEKGFTDYEEGMAYAKEHNKLVFLDFTGYGCVNCRKMEGSVFKDARVIDKLNKDFVMIHLYVDDRTRLPKSFEANVNGKSRTIRTIGDKWSLLESFKFHSQSQPLYVILTPEGKALSPCYGYDEDTEKFLRFLSLKRNN